MMGDGIRDLHISGNVSFTFGSLVLDALALFAWLGAFVVVLPIGVVMDPINTRPSILVRLAMEWRYIPTTKSDSRLCRKSINFSTANPVLCLLITLSRASASSLLSHNFRKKGVFLSLGRSFFPEYEGIAAISRVYIFLTSLLRISVSGTYPLCSHSL